VKNLVKTWERKQGEFECKLRVLEGQQRRNMVEEYPNEGYFDTLKVVEEVFWIKMRVETANWHTESVSRLGKRKGSHPILLRFTSCSKKYDTVKLGYKVIQGTREITSL
jgi:hypothetical protein